MRRTTAAIDWWNDGNMLVESMGNTGWQEQAMEGEVGAKGEIESAEGMLV